MLPKTDLSATNSRLLLGRVLFFGLLMHLERRCIMNNSNASLACLAGIHDFCARRWKDGG